mgnify:CR=1 FL=1
MAWHHLDRRSHRGEIVGTVPAIKSGRGAVKATVSNEARVGKSGSIIIPKGLVGEMGFVEKDRFLIRKTKSGISLKKLY